jgi:hypothetical protein
MVENAKERMRKRECERENNNALGFGSYAIKKKEKKQINFHPPFLDCKDGTSPPLPIRIQ